MAYLRFLRFSAVVLLGPALWGGCCANNQCELDDPLADDAVKLRFRSTLPENINDLDTLIIQRMPKDTTAARPEVVTLVRRAVPPRGDSIYITNNSPFTRVGNANLGNYRYVVQYLTHPKDAKNPNGVNKGVPTRALVIDDVFLQGAYRADGCCTYYTNTAKTVYYTQKGKRQTADLNKLPELEITL